MSEKTLHREILNGSPIGIITGENSIIIRDMTKNHDLVIGGNSLKFVGLITPFIGLNSLCLADTLCFSANLTALESRLREECAMQKATDFVINEIEPNKYVVGFTQLHGIERSLRKFYTTNTEFVVVGTEELINEIGVSAGILVDYHTDPMIVEMNLPTCAFPAPLEGWFSKGMLTSKVGFTITGMGFEIGENGYFVLARQDAYVWKQIMARTRHYLEQGEVTNLDYAWPSGSNPDKREMIKVMTIDGLVTWIIPGEGKNRAVGYSFDLDCLDKIDLVISLYWNLGDLIYVPKSEGE